MNHALGLDTLTIEDCPLCNGSRSALLRRVTLESGAVPRIFDLRKCLSCELVFVDPRPGDSELMELYDEEFYFSTQWPYRALASWVIELIQTRRRHRIERHVHPG